MTIEVFTDGACRGNPGPGGWAALVRIGEREQIYAGAEQSTTNNQMELMARSKARGSGVRSAVSLTTDSQYVRQGITQWIQG